MYSNEYCHSIGNLELTILGIDSIVEIIEINDCLPS